MVTQRWTRVFDEIVILEGNVFLISRIDRPGISRAAETALLDLVGHGAKRPFLVFSSPRAVEKVAINIGRDDRHFPARQKVAEVALELNCDRVGLRPNRA